MKTKQKIDRVNRLRDEMASIVDVQNTPMSIEEAKTVGRMAMEVHEIEEDLQARFDAVIDSILRVSGIKKSKNTQVDYDLTDYMHASSRSVLIEAFPAYKSAPKKFRDIFDDMSFSFPSTWMDIEDDDVLDKVVAKALKKASEEKD